MEADGVFKGVRAKGIDLIGALKKAEEEGVIIKRVAGTSAGAIVASHYAAKYSTYELLAKVPWDELSLIPSGIIGPLQRDGAHISLELEINAESEKGITEDTLQLKIKETLNQIRSEIIDWEEV